ncbi:hypothetical protein VSX64_23295 [Aurantimonas sp. C2-6-R+9]|nr:MULTISPECIES: hypothetical protein [unclassified Aurantimonas]MEC5293505.1 hypothetical protein [Aurantimonas sp. C2-3-R2]MEC5383681.1 hypothetical protein [Aurantimonas sp. C2-6-R+9]MEC5414582.1 hypothetical protein [Aurantimonas sp. C2-4-R8]
MNMMVGKIRPTEVAGSGQAAALMEGLRQPPISLAGRDLAEMPVSTLAAIVVASFRANGHICNVMTHISGARWDRVEEAIRVILDPCAGKRQMTPLAANILDLLCAEHGVTGRIVKPYFEVLLGRLLPADVAARMCAHVACLCGEQSRWRHA